MINDADTRTLSYNDIKGAVEGLKEGLFYTVPSLVAFRDCIQEGQGVIEYDKKRAVKAFSPFVDKLETLFTSERLSAWVNNAEK